MVTPMPVSPPRSVFALGAICILVIFALGAAASAHATSVVTGTVVPDDRFGDYAVIDFRGDPTGSAVTVRQVADRAWRVHDRRRVKGGDLCSKALGPRTVICEMPMWADLNISMGNHRDRASVIGGGFSSVRLDPGAGRDLVDLSDLKGGAWGGPFIFVWGGPGNDRIIGSDYTDYINGRSGKDVIRGRDGNDEIHGDKDADRLYGGKGRDQIDSGLDEVADTISCGRGRDRARFGPGDIFTSDDCEVRTPDAGTLIRPAPA